MTPLPSAPRICMKCKESPAVLVIRLGDPFCRSCFREYFVHKFRAMLGKNRVIFPGEKVLLALSGGPASSAMLRQVQEGLRRETAKKLRFIPGVIYVDEGAVCGQSAEQREQTLAAVEAIMRATGFPFHLAHLEQAFELPSSILHRTHLILHVARTQGYSKVMMGDSCTRVAVKLFINLALGRGAFLAMDTGFLDTRHGDVAVVRPMREYTAKEIAFYNHFFDVPTVTTPALRPKRREKPSIHGVVEKFLLGLQVEFPSSISTVYRTGEKLSPAPAEGSPGSELCLLCLCALDTLTEEELALEPTLILDEEAAGSKAALVPLLCYSCPATLSLLQGPLDTLPPYVRSEAQHRLHRAEMTQQMEGVLLENGDKEPGKS
ncbi:PREDICTED: cytoplasmic tRNA 2-thiolation protein 2 [Tinamus guttatus]|uniref:cytoplasmic tRNA 2-thiolation protein 2 n=1 Tax=Tinamus guttatus TaxID=94827 RepID=UPI00052E8B36|nr:PREDICTED: cytoplasmic tRNA 2-thiolation protein 2 [Tinamus guttatus]